MMHKGKDEVIGIVTIEPEPPSTAFCWVQLKGVDVIKKGAFIVIKDTKRSITFVGQVLDITNQITILGSPSREEMLKKNAVAEDLIKDSLSRPDFLKSLAKVKLMYKIVDNNISTVDTPPVDTSQVIVTTMDLPRVLGFSVDPSKSICLGSLYAQPDVPVCLDLNRMLGGHIAIFGQTWSGKSHAAGVIIEEVVNRGVPVVVFDHMGEYESMSMAVDGGKGLNVIKLVPGSNITIDFDDIMKVPQILTSIGITDAQLNLLRDAYTTAQSNGLHGLNAIRWLLNDVQISTRQGSRVVKRLYIIGRSRGYSVATIDGVRWKLESLLNLGIIGGGYDIRNIVKPGHLTVIDLSTIDQQSAILTVASILGKIIESRKIDVIPPLLVVIEEAHNYVTIEETPSSVLIRNMVRGARHFGVGVALITQRPSGIHRDALNVVNTHIIFRLKGTDLEYVRQFAPLTNEEINDIQLLPDGVAYITGPIIRGGHAIKVRIRERRTVHGGRSIPFIQ
jgi:DNA helicase HerA-like ATPase